MSEAGRLAFADRSVYMADPAFYTPPAGLLDPAYLAARSALIRSDASMRRAQPGDPPARAATARKVAWGADAALDLPSMLFVFMLSTFIGVGVIRRVSRLLHTPLMSATNAISGISLIGSIVTAGAQYNTTSTILGHKVATLKATEAWEAAAQADVDDVVFYRAFDNGIRCIKAPCPTLSVYELNSKNEMHVNKVELGGVAASKAELAADVVALLEGAAARRCRAVR